MDKKLTLTKEQEILKEKLQKYNDDILQYLDSNFTSLPQKEVKRLYKEMAQTAHELHISLTQSGHEPRHHRYMIVNRGCSPESVKFYQHIHPVQDLLAFIENTDANNDPEDITINKKFTMEIFTRRWGHYDRYYITRTESGWVLDWKSELIECTKAAKPGLNKILDHDSVCYPRQVNKFFEYLWDRACEDGLSEQQVQQAIDKICNWINLCEENTPRGILGGLF